MFIRQLNVSDLTSLRELWGRVLGDAYPGTPFSLPDEDIFKHTCHDSLIQIETAGVFDGDHLAGAVKWGQWASDTDPGDFGNILSGDVVILWMVFSDEDAADILLEYTVSDGAKRVYAFPEFGDLGRYTVFNTGMMPLTLTGIHAFFEKRGFSMPEAAAWGAQERIFFHMAVSLEVTVRPLPDNMYFETETEGNTESVLLYDKDEVLAGTAHIIPASAGDDSLPDACFLTWLGVEESQRGKGLGTSLLMKAIELCSDRQIQDLYLTTHTGRPAWKLYERVGFKETCRARSYVLTK